MLTLVAISFLAATPVAAAPLGGTDERLGGAIELRAERRVRLLDDADRLEWEARMVDIGWPNQSLVLAFLGGTFGPSFTLIGGLMTAVGAAVIPALLVPGLGVLVVGLLGLAATVYAIVVGGKVATAARERKDALLRDADARRLEAQRLTVRASSP